MMIVQPQILLIPSSECAIHLCKSLFLHPFRSQRCQTVYLSFHSFCSLFLSLQDPGDFSKSILETPKCTLFKKKNAFMLSLVEPIVFGRDSLSIFLEGTLDF